MQSNQRMCSVNNALKYNIFTAGRVISYILLVLLHHSTIHTYAFSTKGFTTETQLKKSVDFCNHYPINAWSVANKDLRICGRTQKNSFQMKRRNRCETEQFTGSIAFGNKRNNKNNQFSFSLSLKDNDNDNDGDDKKQFDEKNKKTSTKPTEKEGNEDDASSFLSKIQSKLSLSNVIPEFLIKYYALLVQKLPTLKIAFISFVTGLVLAVSAIIVPVYSELDYLREPVTLFETILQDLDNGYVDKVDTQKLFETGVNAMLNSLDPYTEFESRKEAVSLNESVNGKYAGVGLVISGSTLNEDIQDQVKNSNANLEVDSIDAIDENDLDDEDLDEMELENKIKLEKAREKVRKNGIRVVSAFEGYAFDYGMRVGDKLVAIDSTPITPSMTVEDVRNLLRGEPGTEVAVSFEREGVKGSQTVTIPRRVVTIKTVKLATMIGKKEDAVGYVQLSNFAKDSGQEMRQALLYLQQQALETSGGESGLKGIVLDLRGNPGGLLTSAVDISALFVPKNSDIVSARGRGFPNVLYRSRVDPLVSPDTKLAVLVNGGTASAAEIVSGAIQDLDVGVVVGSDRTFGKGLVQNVEELPFETALKFTVAKYYTPSGRCIQSTNYKEGGGSGQSVADSGYKAKKVKEQDKTEFYTRAGRMVKDGGGIEADYKVPAPKASALEVMLLRSGIMNEFASEWSKKYQLSDNFEVTDDLYRDFQKFVNSKQNSKDLQLDALYSPPIQELKRSLKKSGYKASQNELDTLQASIIREVQRDFDKYKKDIKEDLGQAILSRYLPESMLLEKGLKSDAQINEALKLLTSNDGKYNKLLGRDNNGRGYSGKNTLAVSSNDASNSYSTAIGEKDEKGVKVQLNW